ncbi:MAG: ChaN family lipoprotein [Deltaproteobacteria bacterium]|nr:MAG: ChaN family lipoprotein [Deltaproteobacteria bacterium]
MGGLSAEPRAGNVPRFRSWTLVLLACGLVAGCALWPRSAWRARLHAGHPLVGTLWDVAAGRSIGEPELRARIADHPLVLLGEKHDNPDHHRLQAHLLAALVEQGRRPAVAFEMISVDQGPALAELRAQPAVTSREVRTALRWDASGWPAWKLYAPIFETALRARLPIFAADLPKEWIEVLRDEGLPGLEPATRAQLALDAPLPPDAQRALEEEIRSAHCGHALGDYLARMVDVQRARDAQLARALLDAAAAGSDGAVLIAGTGHVRTDRGVPVYLARMSADTPVVSVAMLEVSGEALDADGELARAFEAGAPFDYVWFTPRVDDRDPCERFRKRLETLAPAAEAPAAP